MCLWCAIYEIRAGRCPCPLRLSGATQALRSAVHWFSFLSGTKERGASTKPLFDHFVQANLRFFSLLGRFNSLFLKTIRDQVKQRKKAIPSHRFHSSKCHMISGCKLFQRDVSCLNKNNMLKFLTVLYRPRKTIRFLC